MQKLTSLILMLVLGFGAGYQAFAQQAPKTKVRIKSVKVKHYNFNGGNYERSMWSGLYCASNGKVYIGLSTHADAAYVYEFDPATEKMTFLADLSRLAEERGRGIWTTGKIHVQMQELDGYVYFGALDEDSGPPAIDCSSYQGPHWYRINLETSKVERLSLINSFWGLVGQVMDAERRLLYGLAENGHLYKYIIDKDISVDMGRVDDWDICRTIFMDDAGNVYGSYTPAQLWKYDVLQDRIFDLPLLKLPIINQPRTMSNPMLDRKGQWRIIEWDPVDKVAYGIVGGSSLLFKYDVHDGEEGSITSLVKMCAPQFRDGDPMAIPYATLAMTISQKERKIYYFPVMTGAFDYDAVSFDVLDELKFSEKLAGGRFPPLSYLTVYDLEKGELDDLGILQGIDGRHVYGLGGAQADKEGRIWFVGAFEEPNEAFVAGNIQGEFPYSMGLGCYDPFE